MDELFEILRHLELEDHQQREANLPAIQRNRSISRTTGQYLSMLVRLCKATRIVEIGTSVGYSTLWLGLGARTTNGRVIGYEIDAARVEKARFNIEKAGLSDIVEVRNEDPKSTLLPETDFVFLDAEKHDYQEHFKAIFERVVPGGVIIADNVVSHQEDLKTYINYVRNHSGCNSMLVPIDRGLELTYKFSRNEFNAFKSLFRK